MSGVMAKPVCWLVEDDLETVPNNFIYDKVEESQNLGIDAISEPNFSTVHPNPDPCSKSSNGVRNGVSNAGAKDASGNFF